MKKKILFLIPMLIIIAMLFMLRATGIKVHIAVSVIGLLLLIAYTIATNNEWRNLTLEILQRLFYAIALITGVVIMNVKEFNALSVMHKMSAALFVILLVCVEIHKAIKNK